MEANEAGAYLSAQCDTYNRQTSAAPCLTWQLNINRKWLCWMQATVQAALALLPRDQVAAVYGSPPTTEQGQRYTEYAQNCLTAAVFAILICGSIGTLLIRIFAPVLLQKVSLLEAFVLSSVCPPSACLWFVLSCGT